MDPRLFADTARDNSYDIDGIDIIDEGSKTHNSNEITEANKINEADNINEKAFTCPGKEDEQRSNYLNPAQTSSISNLP